MRRISPKFLWFLTLLPVLFGFDVATKQAVVHTLPVGGEIQVVEGWLSILHAQNPHIAFSTPVPLPLIYAFGVVALGIIGWTMHVLPDNARVPAVGLAAITAGALGNLLDRIPDGSVTDFVKLSADHPELSTWLIDRFGTATWPIFNVADGLLLGGVGLWLVHDLFAVPEDEPDELDGG